MKRNGFILVVSVLLILLTSSVTFAQEVDSWSGLKEALTTGSDIKVTNSITVSEVLNIVGKTNIVNLNGETLSGEGNSYNSGLMFSGGSLTLKNGGSITNLYYPDSTPSSVTGNEFGAIHISSGSILTITDGDLTFSGNTGGLGALNATNGSISVDVNRIVFYGNKSSTQGGGLRHDVSATAYNNTAASITANEIVFSNNEIDNTATVGSGAGAMNSRGNMELLGDTVKFINNSMNATVANTRRYKVGGGAIANQSGENAGSIFNATMVIGKDENSTVIFSGNTSSTYGGAIMNRAVDDDGNATLTINGTSTFSNNSASLGGGAIYNIAQNGHIAQINLNGESTFTNNSATGNGGAIYNTGAIAITNATFGGVDNTDPENPVSLGNSANKGGAIYNTGNATISDAVFTGNSASADGGAIYNEGSLTISNTMFSNNCANGWSGGIETYGDLVISGGSFTNNSSGEYAGAFGIYGATAMIDGTEFKSNTAKDGAGAVYANKKSELTIKNAIFIDNQATASDASGGAIASSAALTITNTTFDRNISHDGGGAIYNYVTDGYVNIKDSVVKNNVSTSGGGMFLLSRTSVSNIDNVEFKGNKAIEDVAADGDGGGAIMIGSEARVKITNNSNFEANTSATRGGAIATRTTEQSNGALGLSIDAATFTTNSAVTDGGAIYVNAWHDADGHDGVKISGSTFTENSAANGGAIYNDAVTGKIGNIIITDSTFTNNSATGNGGAIYNTGAIAITNATFGGVDNTDPENPVSLGNSANKGGAIYNTGNATISDAVFTGNSAERGGAVNNYHGTITFNGEVNFENNSAIGEGHGGALSNLSGTTTFNNGVTFKNNTSLSSGAAIYNGLNHEVQGTVNIIGDSLFDGNIASGGGVIHNKLDSGLTNNLISFSNGNATFTNNQGTVIWNQEDMTFTNMGDVLFQSNTNTRDNSSSVISNVGTLSIIADTVSFIDNENSNKYGAVANTSASSNLSITANMVSFKNNTGGAIYKENDNFTITAQNSGDGKITFEDNSASMASAINNNGNTSKITLISDEIVFENNTSNSKYGGAIFNSGNYVKILSDKITFKDNSATGSTTTEADKIKFGGGAIQNRGNTATTQVIIGNDTNSEVTFENNYSVMHGGAIHARAEGASNVSTIIINGTTTFNQNSALLNGGAISNSPVDGTSTLTLNGDSTFTNNTATGQGGAIYNAGTITINGAATFSGNKMNVVYTGDEITSYTPNDIYNTGTLNLNAGEDKTIVLSGGIDGESGIVNMSGAGLVEVTADIKNQTVVVNSGELHLLSTDIDGSNLSGSTVAVKSGAVINTIDNIVNDYMTGGDDRGTIALATGAIIKGDVDYYNGTADTYAIADGTTSVTYVLANALSLGISGSKDIQVTSDGVTVNASGASFTTDSGMTIASTGSADGKIRVYGKSGGIDTAVETADGDVQINIDYKVTANETFDSAINNTIEKSNFSIEGQGTDPSDPAITLAKNLIVNGDATLKLTDVKIGGSGQLENKSGATLTVKDSSISTIITNYGTFVSDPSTYTAQHRHLGTSASYDNDTFIGATASSEYDRGGAIYNTSTLTLNDVRFYSNTSTKRGGAIYNEGNITIKGGTFGYKDTSTESVTYIQGNTSQYGGAIANNSGSLIIQKDSTDNGTTFYNNRGSYGGAICNLSTTDAVTISDAVFVANSALGAGGAIYNQGNDSTTVEMSIVNSTFNLNTASGYGAGAIYNTASTLSITNSNFTSNQATHTSGIGGAIFNSPSGKLTLTGGTFKSNSAKRGGAIYNSGSVTVTGTSFLTNTATGTHGGAIFTQTGMTIDSSSFTGNSSQGSGGAIYYDIQNGSGDLVVQNGTNFTNNYTAAGTGDTYNSGGAIYVNTGFLSVTGGTYSGNYADKYGAIATSPSGNVSISNATFGSNHANVGGAVGLFGNNNIINNVVFNNNYSTGAGSEPNSEKGGGALFLGAGSITSIQGGTSFTSNTATNSRGGAISTRYKSDNNSAAKLDIVNTTFTSNTAGTDGGAIYNDFYNNAAGEGHVSITNSTFTTNRAANGGAIYNDGADNANNVGNILITDTNFTDNIATSNGGAIYNNGVVTINAQSADVTFSGNKSNYVDAEYYTSNAIYNAGTLSLNSLNSNYKIYMKDGIVSTNDSTMNINSYTGAVGEVVFNANVQTNNLNVAAGTLTNNSDKTLTVGGNISVTSGATFDNEGTLVLTGDKTISGAISGDGSLSLQSGQRINNGTISQKSITISGGSLTTNAGYLTITNGIVNNVTGGLILTGGENGNIITGTGSTVIDGTVVNSSIITNALTINNGKSLTTSAAVRDDDGNLVLGISNTVNNAGTLNLTGGTVEKSISGGGVTHIQGDVINNATAINQSQFIIDSGSLTTNASRIHGGLITNNADDGLVLVGGANINTIQGSGSTVIDGIVSSNTPISSAEIKIVAATTADPDKKGQLTMGAGNIGGTVINNGSLVLTGGTLEKAVSGSGTTIIDGVNVVNSSTITNALTINNGKSLTTSAAVRDADGNLVLGISNTVNNAGTLNLKGGTVENAISGSGLTIIDGIVSSNASISNSGGIQINAQITSSDLPAVAQLTIDADKVGAVVTNNGRLVLTGGTLEKAVSGNGGTLATNDGVSIASTASVTQGSVNISGILTNEGTLIVKSALDSTSGALVNKGNLYLNMGTVSAPATLNTVISDSTGEIFVNGQIHNLKSITQKMITINPNGILKTNANAIQTISGIVNNEANGLIFTGGVNGNANTITGTGTTQILADTGEVINNAEISQGVNVVSGTLRTNASTIATDAGATIKNDGTITLTGGTLSKTINPLTTAGNGTVEIAADANNSVLANAQITGNKIKLTSGALNLSGLADATTGDIDLSAATSLVGNGGRLSVVDNKTGTINLGKVDATVSNINIGINVNYETGDADVLSLTSFEDTTNKIMIDEINVLANPIKTEFSANVADASARDYVDLSATTFSGTGIGSFLISYDKSTGDLKGAHSDLTNAVTSTLTSKVYNMSTDEIIAPLTLSGNTDTAQSLSVTANGHTISAATSGGNGITLGGGANNQSLTINNAVISGFGTAIANGAKGTLTLNGVTVSAATTAAANTISNTKVLNLKGENTLNSTISDGGDLIVIDGATLNTGVISQKTITIYDGAVFTTSAAVRDDLNNLIAGYETTSALLTNNGRLNITGGTVEKTISGDGVTHIQGSVTSYALISTVMTIDDANSLAISADNVGNTVSNEGGTLTLSDGTIVYAVSGSGSTVIDGTVVNSSIITNALIINNGKSLTTSAAVRDDDGNLVLGISNTVNNAGTLNLKGGTVEKSISGGGGIEITGNVLNAAEVSQNNITISGGSLTTNAGLITANTNIINNVDNGLIFTGGTNKNNVAGNGTVKVDTAVQVDNTAVISNGVNLVSGTLQNTGEIKGNVAVTTGTLRTNASTIATDAGATIKNDGTITLTGGTLSKTINPLTTAGNGTVEIAAGTNNSVLANAQITGNKIKLTSGALNLSGLADATTGDIDLSAVTSVTSNGGAISTTNGKFENTNLGNLVLNSDLTYFVDMDILSQKIDTIEINSLDTADKNLKIQVITPTQIRKPITQTVFKMSPISDKITDATLRAKLSQSVNVNGLNNIISPIYKYKPNYDANTGMVTYGLAGHGKGDWKSYNPSILATPIAALTGGYLTQLSTYEEAFTNMDMYMLMTSEQRTALKHANKIADAQVANEAVPYDLYASSNNTNDLWFRPYASYENVHLRRGPKVHNAMYGTFFGGDSKLIELSKGWDVMFSGYVGYTGSHQSYNGVGMYQNGGAIGATAMLFKNNFFAGLTANVGASVADVSTMYGSDDITLLMAGAALRTGYNFEFLRGKFIIQPSMTVSYSFVNTFDYKASSGARLKADPLHAINIQPGFKLIGNFKHGWQPYAGVYFVWNFLDKTKVTAQDVSLPEMSVKPYLRYGFGIQKKVGDRFTGFAQMYLHSIGRSGVSFALGFKWALGKKEPPAPMAQPVFVK